jgi:hypothetical protein
MSPHTINLLGESARKSDVGLLRLCCVPPPPLPLLEACWRDVDDDDDDEDLGCCCWGDPCVDVMVISELLAANRLMTFRDDSVPFSKPF